MPKPIKFDLKIGRIGDSLKVTIPLKIAESLDLKKGEILSCYQDGEKIIYVKKVKE